MDRPVALVDRSVPYGLEAFRGPFRVVPVEPGALADDPALAARADVLVVPSSVRVDARLLAATARLRAIASPVVGRDHVDPAAVSDAARRLGHPLPVFFAPGATAGGVADWAAGALLAAAAADGRDPRGMRVGIWGLGRCGRAVAARLDRLAIAWIAHDPPREARSTGSRGTFRSAPLEALSACDAVTIHVPLAGPAESRWPTRGMVDRAVLDALGAGATRLLLNASRGAVMDGAALLAHLASGARPALVLDVFEGEPAPDPEVVDRSLLATPHVAGSVLEGRWRAACRVREAVRRHLGLPPDPLPPAPPGGYALPVPLVVPPGVPDERTLAALRSAVPVQAWSDGFKEAYRDALAGERAAVFAGHRRGALRREVRWRSPRPVD